MRRIVNWLGTGLIVVGIMLSVWLLNGIAKSDARQQDLMDAFRSVEVRDGTGELAAKEAGAVELGEISGIEGILTILAIDLEAPVLYGADAETLDQSLGAIKNMDPPGEMDGSYAIAGHQAHVFGKYFNRLHEVEVGTEFTFQTAEGEMNFRVFDIQIVRPHDVDVLEPQEGKALISLITCYPEYSNEFRLVVQGERVE
ncbi:class D sortase [Sporosarcina highlanderae]|uniref:Class D sortase n=1 Tax=Sporosarcina highlanderae TaxID=3035916 RepID=A0ABT8JVI5_9BACL|nr:class D sortase [Sporosarcina highlanderae]MDN4609188.1 class D sortase [Sporosarcina highlanderae]